MSTFDRENPYQGLDPYKEEDAFFFFGREEWCQKIIDYLTNYSPIVLYGKSGVGKSSLLQAGVVSHLRQLTNANRKKQGIPKFAIVVFNDWSNPLQNCLDKLMNQVKESVTTLRGIQLEDSFLRDKIKNYQDNILKEAEECSYPLPSQFVQDLSIWVKILRETYYNGKILIILDQFEGYFQSIDSGKKEDEVALKILAEAVNASNLPVIFVFAIQSDEFFRLEQQVKKYIPTIDKNCIELKHLDTNSAKEAIKRPIERYNLLESLKNYSMTVLSGPKNVDKSMMLQMGLGPCWSKVLFETQVGYLCDVASNRLTVEKRKELCDIINIILKDKIKPLSTPENIDTAKDSLLDAISKKYPNASDKLGNFLDEVKEKMGNDYPLETYQYFKLSTYPLVLIDDWNNWKSNLFIKIQKECEKSLRSEKAKKHLSTKCKTLKDVLLFWEESTNKDQVGEKNLLVIFDHFEIYLKDYSSTVFSKEIKPLLSCQSVSLLISINDNNKVNSFLDSDEELKKAWSNEYFILDEYNSLNIEINSKSKPAILEKLAIEDKDTFVDEIIKALDEMDGEQHKIMAPYLQLVMTNLCNKALKKPTKEKFVSLKTVKDLGTKRRTRGISEGNFELRVGKLCEFVVSDSLNVEQIKALCNTINTILNNKITPPLTPASIGNAKDLLVDAITKEYPEKKDKLFIFLDAVEAIIGDGYPLKTFNNEVLIQDGIKEIIDNHVKDAVDKLEKTLIEGKRSNSKWNEEDIKKTNGISTVLRILSHLSTPSDSKSTVSVDDIFNYLQEDNSILDLELPVVEKQDIKDVTKSLWDKRILRSISTSTKNGEDREDHYEIYFNGLSEAFQARRLEYISQIVNIQKNEFLPIRALSHLIRGDIESAAVYAHSAYNNHYEMGFPGELDFVNEAFHQVLRKDFNCLLVKPYTTERDFWQVLLNPKEPMLVASNHDGTLWLWANLNQQDIKSQVDKLCEFVVSDSLTVEQRKALCNTINKILITKIKPPLTPASIGNAKDLLVDAITKQYPEITDKLGKFLVDVETIMRDDNPLKTYKQDKYTKSFKAHNKNLKRKDSSLDIALAFNPDGTILASSSRDKHIMLWNVEKLKLWDGNQPEPKPIVDIRPKLTLEKSTGINVQCEYTSVAFRPRNDDKYGDILAAGDWAGNIWLWDVSSYEKPCLILSKPLKTEKDGDWIWSVAISPDGKTLAAGASDGCVYCWDISNPAEPKLPKELLDQPKDFEYKKREIFSVAFSSCGKWLASGRKDNSISLWKQPMDEEPQLLSPFQTHGHKKAVRAVTFSPMESGITKYLVSASEDRSIRIWNLEDLGHEPKILPDYPCCVRSVVCKSIDPMDIISCGWDGTIRSWIETETEPKKWDWIKQSWIDTEVEQKKVESLQKKVIAVEFNGLTPVLVSSNGTVQVLEKLPQLAMEGDGHIVAVTFFSQKGKILKAAWAWSLPDNQGFIQICDFHNPDEVTKYQIDQEISSLTFSPDGKILVSVSSNSTKPVKLWNIDSSENLVISIEYDNEQEVSSVAFQANNFSQDNHILAVACKDGEIKLWDCHNHDQPIFKDFHPRIFGSDLPLIVAFNPDGKWLASGGDNSNIQIWKVSESNKLEKFEMLQSSIYGVMSLAFSPLTQNEKWWLAVGFFNGSIQLWDLTNLKKGQKSDRPDNFVLKEHDDQVIALSFHLDPDKKKLVLLSGSVDGKVCQWTIGLKELADRLESKLRYRYTENEPNDKTQ